MDVDWTCTQLVNVKANATSIEAQWKMDQERWNQNRQGTREGPPMRPRGGFLQHSARSNFNNVQCYKCQQMGHIARQCSQHPWNQPSESRAHATHDHFEQEEPIHISCTVAKHDPEQREEEYLWKMAGEVDAVKDKLIRKLQLGEDFGSTWTWWPGWGLYIVTLYISCAINLCKFQY